MNHFSHKRAAWAAVGVLLLVGAVVASASVANAQVLARNGGPTANKHYPPGVVGCSSLQTCNDALDPAKPANVKKVILEADILNVPGNGIVIKRDNVVFEGNGRKIVGDGVGQSDVGLRANSRIAGVKIANLEISGFYTGIEISSSTGVVVENVDIHNNADSGVAMGFSNSNTIRNSKIKVNPFAGIFMFQSSNNLIENNVIRETDFGAGVDVFYAGNGNIIRGNSIILNLMGVNLVGNGNSVYHNNFMANNDGFNQASNSGSNNWYIPFDGNLKLTGGNYWDDDLTPGNPSCADSNSDGICDVPHQNGISDLYPFVSPDGWV